MTHLINRLAARKGTNVSNEPYSKKKKEREPATVPVGRGLRKDYLGSQLERQAVRHAVREHYGVDLHDKGRLPHFVQTVGAFAHAMRNKLPGAKAYADHVEGFKDDRLTNDHIKAASEVLRSSGLLGLAGKFLAEKKGHAPLPKPLAAEKPKPGGFVELPKDAQTHEPTPTEVSHAVDQAIPGKIKPATDQTVKPASMRGKDVKARREEAQAGQTPFVDDDAPLPLADVPEEMPGVRHRDRHQMIAERVLAQKKPDEIVNELAEKFGVTPKVARESFRRWLDLARRGMTPEKPERLAREGGKFGPDTHTTKGDLTSGVHPMLRGTRLAAHLLQIIRDTAPPVAGGSSKAGGATWYPEAHHNHEDVAQAHELAKHALKGTLPKGMNGDVFAQLGTHLRRIGHKAHTMYKWGDMMTENGTRDLGIGHGLQEMEFIQKFLAKHVQRPEGMDEREFLRRALKNYSLEATGEEGDKVTEHHTKFWTRLGKAWDMAFGLHGINRGPNAKRLSWEQGKKRMNDAMYRLYTLADDRHTFETATTPKTEGGDPNVEYTQKPRKGVAQPPKTEHWRDHFQKSWANPHMKFQRLPASPDAGDLATMGILLKLGRRPDAKLARPHDYEAAIAGIRAEPGESTHQGMFADYLEENAIPGVHVVRTASQTGIWHRSPDGKWQDAHHEVSGRFPRDQRRNTHAVELSPEGRRSETEEEYAKRVDELVAAGHRPESIPPHQGLQKFIGDSEHPFTQIIGSNHGVRRGLLLVVMHRNGADSRIGHAVHLKTVDELMHHIQDFPPAARTALIESLKTNKMVQQLVKGRTKHKL